MLTSLKAFAKLCPQTKTSCFILYHYLKCFPVILSDFERQLVIKSYKSLLCVKWVFFAVFISEKEKKYTCTTFQMTLCNQLNVKPDQV